MPFTEHCLFIEILRSGMMVLMQRGRTKKQKRPDVRFGSKADICSATRDVRFTPNSDRKSRHAANGHVRFTPESGYSWAQSECPLSANNGHSVMPEVCPF
jgi:hypothetical protein